ncbi:l-mandelate dehydrogenase [Phaffia rhodozyma]|uniref:L-lactate dehydrogenase (cytochrome) n=1 Tax=Phaffia rhodozyma TaxID=264483 RepID=A0A0F7SET1_PHARH|nr:l-mandelate dehydrogenase [Phaffia rhodozyma]
MHCLRLVKLSAVKRLPSQTAVGLVLERRPPPILSTRSFASPASSSSFVRSVPRPSFNDGSRWKRALASASALTLAAYFLLPTGSIKLDSLVAPEGVQFGKRKLIAASEVMKHNTKDSLWIMIDDPSTGQKNVWDFTEFMNDDMHPGGAHVLLAHVSAPLDGGKDATKLFTKIHPKGMIENTLEPEKLVGVVDPTTFKDLPAPKKLSEDEIRVKKAREEMKPIEDIINLEDIEQEARKVLGRTAWAYYHSAGDDEYSRRENAYAYAHYWFNPRILVPVVDVDMSTSLLGGKIKARLPVYISPAAMAKLGHPEGERNLVRAAGEGGIVHGVSINASCSLEEMMDVKQDGQPMLFQIYLNTDREKSKELVKKVEAMNFDGIIFTVDSPVPGNRELDRRTKPTQRSPSNGDGAKSNSKGVAHAISGYQDANLSWDDVTWLQSLTKLPLIIKGIQSVDDVETAASHGVQGVILSNHGGRSLDFSPAPIDVLYELRQTKPELFNKMDVYVDGGIKRGTDVLKALCLGAKAVGLGRPFLYGNGTYGQEGVSKVIEIMEAEIATSMRLLGVTRLDQLRPNMIRYRERAPAPRP